MENCFYVDNRIEFFSRNQNDYNKFYVNWDTIMQNASQTLPNKTRDHTKRVADAAQKHVMIIQSASQTLEKKISKTNKLFFWLNLMKTKSFIKLTNNQTLFSSTNQY